MSAKLAEEIRKRRPFDLAEEEAYLNLWRTFSTLSEATEKLLKSHGLCGTHYNILRILAGESAAGREGMGVLEVRDRLVGRLPDITRLVDKLVAQGLVKRGAVDGDRRKVMLRITKSGLKLSADLGEPIRQLHQAQLGHLSPGELASLNQLLEKARTRP